MQSASIHSFIHKDPIMNHYHYRSRLGTALATAMLFGLSACGGGSDSPVAVTTTTFSGTAATGAAMAGATVSISCANGSGTTITATNGSYSKDLTSITLPCALKAASSDGTTVLYSVTTATATATSSSTQVANITPLTQLLVASLAGTDPAAFFTNFSTSASSVKSSTVSAAQTAVLTILRDAGLDISSLPDMLTGTLVAKTSTTSGNAHDIVLDALKSQLTTSGTTLAALTTAVAAASPAASATTTTTTNVASLPATLLLKTADSNCFALRSGDYWAIMPTMGVTIADQFASGSYNATTKMAKNLAGNSTVLKENGACRYLASDGVSDIVVSQAGVLVARYLDDNSVPRLSFAIPKQTIALSELAGTWNTLGFERNSANTSYAGKAFTATISSTGVVSDVTYCEGASTTSTCSALTDTINLSSNSAGGFDISGNDAGNVWSDRVFAYRAGNGDLMMVEIASDGSVSTWTRKRTLSLPSVSTTQAAGWSVRTLSTLVANALTVNYPTTVTVANSDAGSYTRPVNLANGTADYSEIILINTPRTGYNFRAAGTTTSTYDGRTVSIRERTSLGLRGMGVSV